jgi:hypothetical protein
MRLVRNLLARSITTSIESLPEDCFELESDDRTKRLRTDVRPYIARLCWEEEGNNHSSNRVIKIFRNPQGEVHKLQYDEGEKIKSGAEWVVEQPRRNFAGSPAELSVFQLGRMALDFRGAVRSVELGQIT